MHTVVLCVCARGEIRRGRYRLGNAAGAHMHVAPDTSSSRLCVTVHTCPAAPPPPQAIKALEDPVRGRGGGVRARWHVAAWRHGTWHVGVRQRGGVARGGVARGKPSREALSLGL